MAAVTVGSRNTHYRAARYSLTRAGLPPAGSRQLCLALTQMEASHHNLEFYLRDYLGAAGIGDDKKAPLFRAIDKQTKQLSDRRLERVSAWAMVRRRARKASISTEVCNHTFRATGITAYMANGGRLETAAEMAAHASTRTTQLYNRSGDAVSLDEVERIVI